MLHDISEIYTLKNGIAGAWEHIGTCGARFSQDPDLAGLSQTLGKQII